MKHVIPSDVITLVYKELHIHFTQSLISEYRKVYNLNMDYCVCRYKKNGFMFNYRTINYNYQYERRILHYKYKRQQTYVLPTRYKFSTVREIDCI